MVKKEEMKDCCNHKQMSLKVLILGLLVLPNAYWQVVNWPVFIGGILVIAGVIKLIK